MKYAIYMTHTRLFKLHLKMAYTIFQTPLQASVQVYKYNRCFSKKAVPDPFRGSLTKQVPPKSWQALRALAPCPGCQPQRYFGDKRWCVVPPRVRALRGNAAALCGCSCPGTDGFMPTALLLAWVGHESPIK